MTFFRSSSAPVPFEKNLEQIILVSKDIPAVPFEITSSLFYPFYSNNSFIIIDMLLLYVIFSGVRCELKLSPSFPRTTRRVPRNACASEPQRSAKNALANPFVSDLSAPLPKSAHLTEKKQYQRACFHTHPHSFPANPLITSFYVFRTGVDGGAPRKLPQESGHSQASPPPGNDHPGFARRVGRIQPSMI
jgi:hypothetical protein